MTANTTSPGFALPTQSLSANYLTTSTSETTGSLYVNPAITSTNTVTPTTILRARISVAPVVDLTSAERNAIRALRAAERRALVKADKGTPRAGFSHVSIGSETILEHRPPGSRQRKARKRAK